MDKTRIAETRSESRELQCVGSLEIVTPKPVGFLCGSIPVPTDNSFHSFNSALVPSPHTVVSAPRYRMLPTETDLNTLPVVSNLPDKVLPVGAVQSNIAGELPWEGDTISSNLNKKCDSLAVSGLAEYGDDIDIIASADILKQIFKMPYSKARLSVAVRRIGQTLVLNNGPDEEEGEKLVRRHKSQSKCLDQSLFLNFAMHSVRVEACDCPPSHSTSSGAQPNSSIFSGGGTSQFVQKGDPAVADEKTDDSPEYPRAKRDGFLWENKKSKSNKSRQPIKKAAPSHVGEKPRSSLQESEKHKTVSSDGFLRVLFWQFHNFRMLLGSDLLLFSNEKYIAVSLHLWDVTRKITPLTWLEAWIDNVMASVPELAICYHKNGVVQGYELLKTDDIFLLKGISEDGTPAFNPHVVQQNGLSVLRFLHDNCKQDPGAYWLHKGAGEDVIHLYDLSVIPKSHSSSATDDNSSTLPAFLHRGRSDSLFSLGTLLYRIAHRLSLSMSPNKRAKCALFFKQCLELLHEPDHLVVRAYAHEQFARLLLNSDEELELTAESLPVEYEVTFDEESEDHFHISDSAVCDDGPQSVVKEHYEDGERLSPSVAEDHYEDAENFDNLVCTTKKMNVESNVSIPEKLLAPTDMEMADSERDLPCSVVDESLAVCKMSPKPERVVADPISSKLAAVHHISQAIKSLRWMRQLQSSEMEPENQGDNTYDSSQSSLDFSVCACGDVDCIEVCDIREWLPTSRIDGKLWKLVLLLGESYLALGEAYKEDHQLHQALKVVELACSVYGSMPQHLDDTRFVSSITKFSSPAKFSDSKAVTHKGNAKQVDIVPNDDSIAFDCFSSTYLFWSKAWTLVGDVHVEFHVKKGKELLAQVNKKHSPRDLRMSLEVVKEVQRLKKKFSQDVQNCSSCSLINCSCQSDRASSGSSASSSTGDQHSVYSRKHGKRSNSKVSSNSHLEHSNGGNFCQNGENRKHSKSRVDDGGVEMDVAGSAIQCVNERASRETPKVRSGGIFKYLEEYYFEDPEFNLSAALSCYKEARKALGRVSTGATELLQSVKRKMGWVCNEMGRNRLESKDLGGAELAFADAISAFREVSDFTNIILIYCNLGHGRRALAEEVVSKIESLKGHAIFRNAYEQALQTAKVEYSESLRYYGAAKWELKAIAGEAELVPDSLKNEVYTQLAHTYLRLGMLLAREEITTEVYENTALEDVFTVCAGLDDRKARKEVRKHEISANDALREALSLYDSLGELRRQESAYAHFQLACYQSDCCLKFLGSDHKKKSFDKGENNILQRVKQYSSLAERNWQKAMDYYGPTTHPTMYLNILIERSALLLSLATSLHSNAMLESAVSRMLEGRHISGTAPESSGVELPEELCAKFWSQMQMILKKMLSTTLSANSNKSSVSSNQPSQSWNKHGDAAKLRELYKMSLKCNDLSQLHGMYSLWTS